VKRTNGDSQDSRLNTGAPRWVKVFGIIAIVLVLLLVVLHLSGHGMNHMEHLPS